MCEHGHNTSPSNPLLSLIRSPIRNPSSASENGTIAVYNTVHTQSQDVELAEKECPKFERHGESTTIELFYDLFFVANLANFSSIHEIQTVKTLTSYVGFFCVLWFTWCLTSLHDLRYGSDCVLSRMFKGIHLGIMVGLAVCGPKFQNDGHMLELRVLALILMASRLTLAAQYFLVLIHTRKYQNTTWPLSLISGFSFAAAIVYLGISFAFPISEHAYRAFYVIAVAEMIVNIGVSAQWTVASFKGTHLVERMSLLTLYILGEGVIDVLKSVAKISQTQDIWSSGAIGVLVAAISTIYILYMLYFDSLSRHYAGSFRQQLWSFLHFPFHAALVLSLAGMAQFVIWQKILEAMNDFVSQMKAVIGNLQPARDSAENQTESFIAKIRESIDQTFAKYPPESLSEMNATMTKLLETLQKQVIIGDSKSLNTTTIIDTINEIGLVVESSIMTTFGLDPAKEAITQDAIDGLPAALVAQTNTTALIFQYFFIATGFTLIILGILGSVNRRTHTVDTWLRFGTHVVLGSALCLICLLAARNDGKSAAQFATTPWPLPMVTIVVFIVITIHHLIRRAMER